MPQYPISTVPFPYHGKALGFQQISAFTGVVSLTVPAGADLMVITVETSNVRFRDDGVAPTASVGFLLTTGSILTYSSYLSGQTVGASLQFIPVSGSATLDINYYK